MLPLARVFVGPSLNPTPEISGVEMSAPARRGDVLRAVAEGIRIIGLIDGEFGNCLAVSPKEIVEAAEAGALIYGAASMGALRACECPRHMVGIGKIYEDFVDGRLASDDEVATMYIEDNYRIVAHPLANLRLAMRRSAEFGLITLLQAEEIIHQLANIPFCDRDDDRILSTVIGYCGSARAFDVMLVVRSPESNQKRFDALALLAIIRPMVAKYCHKGDIAPGDLR